MSALVAQCRLRAEAYLDAHELETGEACFWRHSPTHDLETHPSHLLYGTWAGAMASVLIGRDQHFDADKRARIGVALNGFQRPDGTYTMPGVKMIRGHDDEYLALHCTNYTLGALHSLGLKPRYPLHFMNELATSEALADWMARRDWSQTWKEGNSVVNLASFYAWLAEEGHDWAGERLQELADWHDENQNEHTGFWHNDAGETWTELKNAMAGGAHNLHIYFYLRRDVPRAERIVDSCLKLGYMGIRSSCMDIDFVDIVTAFRRYGHRVDEIDEMLRRYLIELLQVQNDDGGFADTYVTPHTIYGQTTPALVSSTWTTWFRLATIGMIVCALNPEQRSHWRFRDTLGMGYCNVAIWPAAPAPVPESGRRRRLGAPHPTLLAIRRKGRFARQGLLWRTRRFLGR